MPEDLWLKILDDLLPWKASIEQGKVLPYLMQEPLIDKTIFRKIDQIYERFPKTFVELSSNGAALTPKVTEKLLEAFEGRRNALWVSFHGVDQESFETLMKLNYDRALSNLIHLLKRADGHMRVIIRGAGQPRQDGPTFFDREAYLTFWQRIFSEHSINTSKIHVDAFTYHDRAGTLHREERGASQLNLGKIREIGPGHPPFSCPRVTEWVHIGYDGRLRLCCMDYHGEVSLPSLNEMSLEAYFSSEAYADLVARVTGTVASEPHFICKRCISPGG